MTFLSRISLSQWIILSLIAGVAAGWISREFLLLGWDPLPLALQAQLFSTLFLHLVKCIIVPLLFSTLVVGIAGHAADGPSIARLALKSLAYFMLLTALSLFLGFAAADLLRPGEGIQVHAAAPPVTQPITFRGVIERMVPQSFFDAAARNDVLQVVVYSLIFAVALSQVKGPPRQTILHFLEALAEVMFKFTGLVMKTAPLGVFGAITYTIADKGPEVLWNLAQLVLSLYGALAVFVIGVLIPVMLISRIPVGRFFRTIKDPALLAFTTATSEAALPDALKKMEQFGVSRRIASFVIPAGYSFNLAGSTLYLGLACAFVAQAAGRPLDLATQLVMGLTLMLTSKGIAGVPRASLVILSGTLASFGLPLEGVGIILGVDAFLDMARTSVNLIGNCLAGAVMARWEGELNIPAEDPHAW